MFLGWVELVDRRDLRGAACVGCGEVVHGADGEASALAVLPGTAIWCGGSAAEPGKLERPTAAEGDRCDLRNGTGSHQEHAASESSDWRSGGGGD